MQALEIEDAVLEINLQDRIIDYVRSGGDIGEIPRMLGRGLVGYPLIASMLRRWTRMLGIEGGAATWEALKNDLMKHLEYSVLDRPYKAMRLGLRSWTNYLQIVEAGTWSLNSFISVEIDLNVVLRTSLEFVSGKWQLLATQMSCLRQSALT